MSEPHQGGPPCGRRSLRLSKQKPPIAVSGSSPRFPSVRVARPIISRCPSSTGGAARWSGQRFGRSRPQHRAPARTGRHPRRLSGRGRGAVVGGWSDAGPGTAVLAIMAGVPPATAASPLIGRERDSRRLGDLVGLGGEPGGNVLLGGDAGVGKSRLIAELSVAVQKEGWRVLVGHCLDFGDSALPYLPFSEAFGHLADEDGATTRSLVEASPAIARLLPAHRRLADAGQPRARPRPVVTPCSMPSTAPWPSSGARCRCCSSSRTSTGRTSRPGSCSPFSSPAPSVRPWPWSRRTAPMTSTAATRCGRRWPSGAGWRPSAASISVP